MYDTLRTYVDILSWLFKLFVHSHFKGLVWRGSIRMGSAKPIKRPCRPCSTTNVTVSKSSMLRRWALTLTVTCTKRNNKKIWRDPKKRQTEQCSKKKNSAWWKSSQGVSPLVRIWKRFTWFGQYCINWFWGVCPLKVVWKEGFLCEKTGLHSPRIIQLCWLFWEWNVPI